MQYKCSVCGYVYDEEGIDPITGEKNIPWSELPEDWICPKCNAPKADFKPAEEDLSSDDSYTDYDEEDTDDLDNF
ncbi:MAG: rubredoxin [Minisyncoccia bacterium]